MHTNGKLYCESLPEQCYRVKDSSMTKITPNLLLFETFAAFLHSSARTHSGARYRLPPAITAVRHITKKAQNHTAETVREVRILFTVLLSRRTVHITSLELKLVTTPEINIGGTHQSFRASNILASVASASSFSPDLTEL